LRSLPLEVILLDTSVLLFLVIIDVDSLIPVILQSLFLLVIFLLLQLLLILIVFFLLVVPDDARGLIEVHLHAGVCEVRDGRGGVSELLRLVMGQNSHLSLHLEGIGPDCLKVGSDRVVVSILVYVVLSGRDGVSVKVLLVLGDSILLLRDSILMLMAQMLLVLILDLLEVVKDLGDLLFVGGDALIEKQK